MWCLGNRFWPILAEYSSHWITFAGIWRGVESVDKFNIVPRTLIDLCLVFLRNLQQEPCAFFRLVGPVIQKAIACIVASL